MSSSSSGADAPVACVRRAVAARVSAEQLRAVIDMYASEGGCAYTPGTYEARRAAAVNYRFLDCQPWSPLFMAHHAGRGDLVGVRLEAGADARAFGRSCSPLALAISYGLTATLRALLRSGLYDVDAPLHYSPQNDVRGAYDPGIACRAVHLAIVPPGSPPIPPPRLDALEVLVREFGADVNARDQNGWSPIDWLQYSSYPEGQDIDERALDALLALGADLEARDPWGRTPLCSAVANCCDFGFALLLLFRGASADTFDTYRQSPLMRACCLYDEQASALVPRLLRASSRETRRLVSASGWSALDQLVTRSHLADEPWYRAALRELLRSGVPVHPDNAHLALAYAARAGSRLGARAAASARLPPPWQAHEAAVGLALDLQELRDVDEGVRVREARVAELERALLAEKEEAEGQEESDGEQESDGEEEEGSGKEEGSGSGSGDGGA